MTTRSARPDRFIPKERTALEQLLYTTTEVAAVLHISRSKVYDLLRMNLLPSVKIGRLRRIPAEGVRRYLDDLAEAS